jgi:hypothetical protein
MGLTVGTDNKNGLPLYLKFLYGGTEIAWRQPYKINNFSNSGESVDGKYRISDLDVSFIDPNGSYFATQFGRGTLGFGSSFEVVAYLGGTMEYQAQGVTQVWKRLGTAGAYVSTVHTGKVHGISYNNRILRIRSKTTLALVENLKWQFPVTSVGVSFQSSNTQLGSFYFATTALQDTYLGSTAFYDFENGRSKWKCSAYVLGTLFSDITTAYPAMSGRGTVAGDSNFKWCGTDAGGTNFYDTNDYSKFEGTYFGTKSGTITTNEEAMEYGYPTVNHAEAAKFGGSMYAINKTRFRSTGTASGNVLYFLCPMTIDGTPKQVFEYLLTGAMVSPYFTSSDLDTAILNQSGTLTAYSYFRKKIDFDERPVLDSLKDVIESTQALFSVNSSNKFEFLTYGPKNLRDTIPSLGTADIISSSFDNLEEDYFNRFVVKYNYDALSGKYASQYEHKGANWSRASDRFKEIKCSWIQNPNEAAILAQRLTVRFANTLPHIQFTTNLNQIGRSIGSLLTITDANSLLSNKVIQITGYNKDWQNRTIDFDALDAEALYQRKGFCFWGTKASLPGDTVTTSSVSGWGTLGTVNNINGSLYGSQFSWW